MKKAFFLSVMALALVSTSFAQEKTNDMAVNGRATIIRAWEKNNAVQPAVVKDVKKVSETAPAVFLTAGTSITISGGPTGTLLHSPKKATSAKAHQYVYGKSTKKRRSGYLTNEGTNVTWASPSGGGGTVSTYAADKRSPVFTTSVSSKTTTPSVSYTILGSNTGSNAPTWSNVALAKDVTGEKPKPIKKE